MTPDTPTPSACPRCGAQDVHVHCLPLSETVTANRTSEAVAGFVKTFGRPENTPPHLRSIPAIAAKYQKMEKALKKAIEDLEHCIESPENHDIETVRDALAYDPLSE